LFYRGSVPKNLVPVEEVTKTGSISTLSLGVSCFAYKALENKNGKRKKRPSQATRATKDTNIPSLKSLMELSEFGGLERIQSI
jgi:hypothetical protein